MMINHRRFAMGLGPARMNRRLISPRARWRSRDRQTRSNVRAKCKKDGAKRNVRTISVREIGTIKERTGTIKIRRKQDESEDELEATLDISEQGRHLLARLPSESSSLESILIISPLIDS